MHTKWPPIVPFFTASLFFSYNLQECNAQDCERSKAVKDKSVLLTEINQMKVWPSRQVVKPLYIKIWMLLCNASFEGSVFRLLDTAALLHCPWSLLPSGVLQTCKLYSSLSFPSAADLQHSSSCAFSALNSTAARPSMSGEWRVWRMVKLTLMKDQIDNSRWSPSS